MEASYSGTEISFRMKRRSVLGEGEHGRRKREKRWKRRTPCQQMSMVQWVMLVVHGVQAFNERFNCISVTVDALPLLATRSFLDSRVSIRPSPAPQLRFLWLAAVSSFPHISKNDEEGEKRTRKVNEEVSEKKVDFGSNIEKDHVGYHCSKKMSK